MKNFLEIYWPRLGVAIYFGLVGFGFYALFISKSGYVTVTPWHNIANWYIYVFFTATGLLGFLLLTKINAKLLLGLLVVQTFLLVSYLPLTHDLIYGADGWRHIAAETRLLEGLPDIKPVLSNGNRTGLELGDFAYSGFRGSSVMLAKLFRLDLITITKWLGPIVWALFFPLLLYSVGRALKFGPPASLFLVWLSLLPFALQAIGSFTLPPALGLLWWLLGLLLVLQRLQKSKPKQVYALLGILFVLVFNHTLYLVLFALTWLIAELINRKRRRKKRRGWRVVFLIVIVYLTLPTLEIFAGFSYLDSGFSLWSSFKQLAGNFTAYYLAAGPRPHDILTGNIIFNQTPSYSFVENIFTVWRWWLPVFMIGFWSVVILGCQRAYQQKNKGMLLLFVLTLGLTFSYLDNRYFLSGEQVLHRRLDPVLALLFIILFVNGLKFLRNKYLALRGRAVVITGILVLSVAITTSYSLGPDTMAVSLDQYRAMEHVWGQEKNNKHCVIAGTYPLLALEAISKKEIIGGGFPIDEYFAQPELTEIWNKFRRGRDLVYEDYYQELPFDLTKAEHCWLVTDEVHTVPPSGQEFGKVKAIKYNKDTAN